MQYSAVHPGLETFAAVEYPDRPLRIAHVVLSMDVGGLEHVVLDLLRQGRAAGHDLTVICLERPGALAPSVEALGATVLSIGKKPGLSLQPVIYLRRALLRIRPHIIHTHQLGALVHVRAAFYGRRRPRVVHTEHGKHYARRWRNRILGRFGSGGADRFFCVSEDVAAEVRKAGVASASMVSVVPNGIDTSRFANDASRRDIRKELGIPADAPIIGTVGRLAEIKRQDILIRGFAQVARQFLNAHLVLVGDGPMAEPLRQLAAESGVADKVHFAGYQADPAPFVRSMTIFALTSRSEGMPLSVLEAWAAGIPVVASRVGGLTELIRQNSTGLLFENGNVAEFAASVVRLLQDEELRRGIISAARHRVQREFDVRGMAERYHQCYRTLVAVDRDAREITPAPRQVPSQALV